MKEETKSSQKCSVLVHCLPWVCMLGHEGVKSTFAQQLRKARNLLGVQEIGFYHFPHEEAEAHKLKSGCLAFWLRAPSTYTVSICFWQLLSAPEVCSLEGQMPKLDPKPPQQFLESEVCNTSRKAFWANILNT